MLLRHWLPLCLGLAACNSPRAPENQPVESSPDARLSAPSASTPAALPALGACPLDIRPGASLGPVRIGESRSDLERHDLPVKTTSRHELTEFVEVGPLHATLCGGKVTDIWLDDLRKAPDCVRAKGEKVPLDLPRERLLARFSDCKGAPPRTGGTFEECESGGVRVGHGLGDFIQIRVGKTGTHLDDTCEMLLDDGAPTPLAAEARGKMLQKVLDLDLLAPFWHRELPGRDPLPVIRSEFTSDSPSLSIFGSRVLYLEKAEAERKKLPFFEFTSVRASKTKARIEFRFPAEGVLGHVEFTQRYGEWQLSDKSVRER